MSGADIFAQYPDYQTYSGLDQIAIDSVLIISVLGFTLGFLTQLWTLWDVAFKTHASIYWVFQDTFGPNFANVILGQFRDLFTPLGMFGILFTTNKDMFFKLGKWVMLSFLNMIAIGFIALEFYQANLLGSYADGADVLAFSVLPISTIIYGVYSYLQKIHFTISP